MTDASLDRKHVFTDLPQNLTGSIWGITKLCCPSYLQNLTSTPLKMQCKRSCKWTLVRPVVLAFSLQLPRPRSECGVLDEQTDDVTLRNGFGDSLPPPLLWKPGLTAERVTRWQPWESEKPCSPVALSWKLGAEICPQGLGLAIDWLAEAFGALKVNSVFLKNAPSAPSIRKANRNYRKHICQRTLRRSEELCQQRVYSCDFKRVVNFFSWRRPDSRRLSWFSATYRFTTDMLPFSQGSRSRCRLQAFITAARVTWPAGKHSQACLFERSFIVHE